MIQIKDIDDIAALTAVVVGEAAGETIAGKMAVACVIRNRRNDQRWPDVVKDVIFQRYQFTCMNGISVNGDIPQSLWDRCFINQWSELWWRECRFAAWGAAYDWYDDITDGANHYYAHNLMGEPSWAHGLTSHLTIGGHTFYQL
jgi:N-acetylmuramoyl-L-alanine amidase